MGARENLAASPLQARNGMDVNNTATHLGNHSTVVEWLGIDMTEKKFEVHSVYEISGAVERAT